MTDAAPVRNPGALPVLGLALLLAALTRSLQHGQRLDGPRSSAAVAPELDPSLHRPGGSVRTVGDGTDALIARVPDASRWSGREVHAAGGLAAGWQADDVHQVATAFALAGFFASGRQTATVGSETRTRIVFEGPDGGERLLYVIRTSQEVVWLTAHSN